MSKRKSKTDGDIEMAMKNVTDQVSGDLEKTAEEIAEAVLLEEYAKTIKHIATAAEAFLRSEKWDILAASFVDVEQRKARLLKTIETLEGKSPADVQEVTSYIEKDLIALATLSGKSKAFIERLAISVEEYKTNTGRTELKLVEFFDADDLAYTEPLESRTREQALRAALPMWQLMFIPIEREAAVDFLRSERGQAFAKLFKDADEWRSLEIESLSSTDDEWSVEEGMLWERFWGRYAITDAILDISKAMPEALEEIRKYKRKRKKAIYLQDFFAGAFDNDSGKPPIYYQILEAVEESRSKARLQELLEAPEQESEALSAAEIIAPTVAMDRGALRLPPKNIILTAKVAHWQSIDCAMREKGEDIECKVIDESKKRAAVYTVLSAALLNGEGVAIEGEFTPQDNIVQQAICTLFEYARSENNGAASLFITADMVYRVIEAESEARPTQKKRAEIDRRINAMSCTRVRIDATAEAIARRLIPAGDHYKLSDYMLPLRKHERIGENGEALSTVWELTREPVLLTLAKKTRQMQTIQREVAAVRRVDDAGALHEVIPSNDDRCAIRWYLIERIGTMKYEAKKKKGNLEDWLRTIVIDTVLQNARISTTDRNQIKRYRDYCIDCMRYWTATKHIKGYEIISEGKKLKAIKVTL